MSDEPSAKRAKSAAPDNTPSQSDVEIQSKHVLSRARELLLEHCSAHGVDDSHGVNHAECVLQHTKRALGAAKEPISEPRTLSVLLAALLHDADDHKYFGKASSKALAHASRIMEEAGASTLGPSVIPDALTSISLVSCSANGNSCPDEIRAQPEMLWPRWADRLEAAGEIGVARCYLHNLHAGDPLSVESTPRPTSEAEAFKLATEERFADYQRRGGSSASMIDHYFDKLLQVARPHPSLVRNGCTCRAIEQRGNCMRRPCHRPSYHQGTYLILLLLLLRFCRLAASPNPVMMLRAACSRLSSTSHPPPPSPQTSRRRHATVCVRYWTSC